MNPISTIPPGVPVFSTGQTDWSFDELHSNGNDYAYVIDGKGWKLSKRNGLSVALIAVDRLEGLPVLDERIEVTTAKLPLSLIRKVTAFFAEVYKQRKSEAVGYLYYGAAAEPRWDFMVPPQTATGASANYEPAGNLAHRDLAGTIHSHGSMSAFHSGTDHKDEQDFDGIHITIGKVDGASPEYSCSVVVQGKRALYKDPSAIIDNMAPLDEVPQEWLAAVKESAPREAEGKEPDTRYEKLYDLYFDGMICEAEYKDRLEALRRLDEKREKQNERKERKQQSQKWTTLEESENRRWGFFDGRRFG